MLLRIRFGAPYTSSSKNCTGSKMTKDGYAELTEIEALAGVILYPYADKVLSKEDYKLCKDGGLDLIDAPRENLQSITTELCKNSQTIVRALPSSIIANNPFYRQIEPKYFTAPNRFSTVEAAIIALVILGEEQYAFEIARKYEMTEIIIYVKKALFMEGLL